MDTQMLIAITGLPGTGKTTFAISLAKALQLPHFNSDMIRNELGMRGRYDQQSKNLVYTDLMNQVDASLQKGKSVIIDATFYKRDLRNPIMDLGAKNDVPVAWIELQASEQVIQERMKQERLYSEADYGVYVRIKKEYEPLKLDHLVLKSDQSTISEMLDEAVAYLSSPLRSSFMTPDNIKAFQASIGSSQLEESHISWIVFTEQFAYKISKPIHLPYLDFSTLEKRKKYGEEEIRLNNRLTTGIYLAVVPIRLFNESFSIEGTDGPIIEYAVKMKRLPEQRLMSRMLTANTVKNSDIEAIAEQLVHFHQKALPVEEIPSIEILNQDFSDLLHVKHIILKVLGEEAAGQLEEWSYDTDKFLKQHEERIYERYQQHFYIYFHGDLHAANIFLLDHPVIFDCIAFNQDFCKGDILNELAFFCMDMDSFNRADLGHLFLQNYLRLFPCLETDKDQLIFYFYKLYRANIRLKVNALKWEQSNGLEEQTVLEESISKYFNLMKDYTQFLF